MENSASEAGDGVPLSGAAVAVASCDRGPGTARARRAEHQSGTVSGDSCRCLRAGRFGICRHVFLSLHANSVFVLGQLRIRFS